MDKFEKLQELITDFVSNLNEIGFEVFGANEGSSLVIEIVNID
ncbi:TPA: hypothetical protein ACMVA2_000203 [Clostridioides difficile]|nr:hypothetical protein [Clostridioides difficile]MDC2934624.1 hypothetical protein [Clostridioides difficile]MDE3492510.1 hypothetical protein [Clostridioides difficile]MDE3706822.1 hypothetical protein [Clostridioides difficile]MDS6381658.1 hypothetical protein [Clostridioides difficile]